MKTNRIFIVGPNYDGDTLHIVCKTNKRNSLFDIYMADDYEEIDSTGDLASAIKIAKKNGAKRPSII